MHAASRFTIETDRAPADETPHVETTSLAAVHAQALAHFRCALANVVMLGPSLQEHSSFTTHAANALVGLLVAKRRLIGNAARLDTGDILRENRVPEDIGRLLLERTESTMLQRLASEQGKMTIMRNDGTSRSGVFEEICATFHAEN